MQKELLNNISSLHRYPMAE